MTTVIFRSRLHWEGATRAVLKSSSENHVSEEHFSNWQGRAMTHWQSDRVIVSDRGCVKTLLILVAYNISLRRSGSD